MYIGTNIKKIVLIIVVALILIALLGYALYFFVFKGKNTETDVNYSAEGIYIISPKVNEVVTSPIKVIGAVDGGGWTGLEGRIGSARLVDPADNLLAEAPLTATTDWTQKKISFETELVFDTNFKGPAIIFFHNENPSGDQSNEKEVGWPVFIR